MNTQIPVILDVDTGSDDAAAILLALLSDRLKVLGITVVRGAVPLSNCVQNTLQVLDLVGMGAQVPVYPGCPAPMVRELTPGRLANHPHHATQAYDKQGRPIQLHPPVLPIPAPHTRPQITHACTYLIETLKNSPQKVTLISVGMPTNLGMAFRMDPTIADKVEEVVFMGGSVDKGNATPVAESNFFRDPEAAKIVLDSGVACRIIGLNATHSAEFHRPDAARLASLGTPAGRLVADMIENRIQVGESLGWTVDGGDALHDALAVASVIDPTVITDLRREPCDMDINGGAGDGQLIVDHRGGIRPDVHTAVAYRADKEKFLSMLLAACAG